VGAVRYPGKDLAMIGSKKLWGAGILALALGCSQSAPFCEMPVFAPGGVEVAEDANPVYIPLGPAEYGRVFETCLSVLADYRFEVIESDRYDGTIVCKPRVAPGLGLILKPGSPDLYERLLSMTQSYRHRVLFKIHPAEQTGFFVQVTVFRELEDVPRPLGSVVGPAIFKNEFPLDRQLDVVDPMVTDRRWIPRGRDLALEQELIRRLKKTL